MEKAPLILWLASWYPTKLDPFPGDFIRRHAKAFALYHPVHVLHIAKDEKGVITKDIFIEENISGNLHETIIYYHSPQTGISALSKILSTLKFLQTGKRFIKKITASHTSVFIHVHVAMRHGLLALWAKKRLRINYVITEHWAGYDRTVYPEHLRPPGWYWAATKKIFRGAFYFYPEVKKVGELINQTIAPINYKPISNSVDTSLFFPCGIKTDPKQLFHFVHVSTLSYQKNIEGILTVIEKWSAAHSNAHFTIIGPASSAIINRIKDSPILSNAVTLTGELSYENVAEQVRSAHAMIMFSRYENQPCVILEALCCGLPVISTNVGGIKEVINETNGILIDSEDENALYNAIDTMINNYERFNAAQIASDAMHAYSYETIGKQILEYYKQDMAGYFWHGGKLHEV